MNAVVESLIANEELEHILRILNTNVDGNQKIMFALTSIKGIGRRLANIVCKKADVDMNRSKIIVKLKYADLVSILPTNVSVVVWPVQIRRFNLNISTMNTLKGPTCLLYAEDALRTVSLPEAYTEIVLNLPYKLFRKCTSSPLNITPVNASGFVQSHSKNWFRENDSSLI
ncbi:hypothetical protein ABKV19_004407 [Rosa sericea]